MAGYIKIHKKLREWRWYNVPTVRDTFLHLILTANYKDGYYRDVEIKRGQAVFGYDGLSAELGFSVQQIRTAIKKLVKSGEISIKTNHQYSIATITKYDDYQQTDNRQETQENTKVFRAQEKTDNGQITDEQQTDNERITNDQRTDNGQITASKNKRNKEVNKEKEIIKKEKCGIFQNVLLTKEELSKLKERFSDYKDRIDRLSEYIASTGKVYKSHYATILSWARKDKPPDKKGSVYSVSGASFDVSKFERESSMFD